MGILVFIIHFQNRRPNSRERALKRFRKLHHQNGPDGDTRTVPHASAVHPAGVGGQAGR